MARKRRSPESSEPSATGENAYGSFKMSCNGDAIRRIPMTQVNEKRKPVFTSWRGKRTRIMSAAVASDERESGLRCSRYPR